MYRDDQNSVLKFSRSVSSTGVSSYRLQGKEVTYEAYEAALKEIGVLIKARNFLVFQGDVEAVANKSASELTNLIEHISGSASLASEYEDLRKRREEAEERAIFLLQKKKMYAAQKRETKDQKDEAEAFVSMTARLAELKSQQLLWNVYQVKSGMEACESEASAARSELETLGEQQQELQLDLEEKKRALAKLNRALTAAEKKVLKSEKQLAGVKASHEESQCKGKSLRKTLADLEKSKKLMEADFAEQQRKLEAIQSELGEVAREESTIRSELTEVPQTITAAQSSEYAALKERVAAATSRSRGEEQRLESEARSRSLEIAECEASATALRTEIALGEQLVSEFNEQLARLQTLHAAANKDEADTQQKLTEVKGRATKIQNELSTHTSELQQVSAQVREAGDDTSRSRHEELLWNAVTSMKRIFPGVLGKLRELCRPIQKRYEQAVAVAGGRNMEALVVDTRETAAECIRYLRDQRVGTLLILPLDTLQYHLPAERLRMLGENIRLCVDLIECENGILPAVHYAVGDTVVCDTLDDAQELCFVRNERVKAVTLQGQIIGKAGQMTGGSLGNAGNVNWEKNTLERLKRRQSELEDAISVNDRALVAARSEILTLETDLRGFKSKSASTLIEINRADQRKSIAERQVQQKTETLEKLLSNKQRLMANIADLESRINSIKDKRNEIESSIFGPFCASLNVNSVREIEDSWTLHQQRIRRLSELGEQRASLLAQMSFEQRKDFKLALDTLQQQKESSQKILNEFQEAEQKFQQELETIRQSIRSDNAQVDDLISQRKEASSSVHAALSAISDSKARLDAITKKVNGAELQIERHRVQLHELLQKARLEEVVLPTIMATPPSESDRSLAFEGASRDPDENSSSNSSSVHFSRASDEVVALDQRKLEMVDLSSIRDQVAGRRGQRPLSAQQQQRVIQEIEAEIAKINSEVHAIQPNMHAVERFDAIEGKLGTISAELEVAKTEAASLATSFERIKRNRQSLFQECFKHVSESLGLIYRDLTRSSKHPLGGNAYLTLDNSEEPYLGGLRYTAMPPMKRFRDMDQLSGGEKTMAALALLFAIHSFRQAPFFILDGIQSFLKLSHLYRFVEVDAALDNVNVNKICNYIRQRSKDFQCIVISLKDMFFEHADSLVGVCKDIEILSSKVLTLDLKAFDAKEKP